MSKTRLMTGTLGGCSRIAHLRNLNISQQLQITGKWKAPTIGEWVWCVRRPSRISGFRRYPPFSPQRWRAMQWIVAGVQGGGRCKDATRWIIWCTVAHARMPNCRIYGNVSEQFLRKRKFGTDGWGVGAMAHLKDRQRNGLLDVRTLLPRILEGSEVPSCCTNYGPRPPVEGTEHMFPGAQPRFVLTRTTRITPGRRNHPVRKYGQCWSAL